MIRPAFELKLQVREPENGDWLRRIPVLQCVFALPTVPVPFFGRRHRGTWNEYDLDSGNYEWTFTENTTDPKENDVMKDPSFIFDI